jgi:hypothetical protein
MNTMRSREVKGSEILWNADQKSDLMGNFTHSKRGETMRTYAPSSQMYVFPMNAGANSTIKVVETASDKVVYDLEIRIAVVGEEEIDTPRAGSAPSSSRARWRGSAATSPPRAA